MRKNIYIIILIYSLFYISTNWAQTNKNTSKIKFYGDVRLRTELDRDSKKANGEMRPDRDRFRFRFNLAFQYLLNRNIELGSGIRTGNPDNPQSSNVTIGDGFSNEDLSIDKAYIKYHSGDFYIWGGKNKINLWEPDEMLWDADVHPEGIGVGQLFKWHDNLQMQFNGGFFLLTDNLIENNKQTFDNQENISFAQFKFAGQKSGYKWVFAPGIMHAYMTASVGYNYNIFMNFLSLENDQWHVHIDYFKNFEDLNQKVDRSLQDEKSGYSLTGTYRINKLSLKVSYAHIEKYAVIDRFAQDNWVRWSGDNMTRSSNFGGIGLGLKYQISNQIQSQIKYWKVEGLQKASYETALETGTRIRWDLKIKF